MGAAFSTVSMPATAARVPLADNRCYTDVASASGMSVGCVVIQALYTPLPNNTAFLGQELHCNQQIPRVSETTLLSTSWLHAFDERSEQTNKQTNVFSYLS
jgi:hypothetical protein